MTGAWIAFALLAPLAVVGGWLVFRFDSMVRATYALMVSFLAVAVLLLLLGSEFLFAITFLMMIGEMMIMVMFMVAFMMNPAGLNPMTMVHQPKLAAGAGLSVFALLSAGILTADFPERRGAPPEDVTAAIGFELMGPSMLVFETAGVTLLAGMIAVIALAARKGRFGDAITVERREDAEDAEDGEDGEDAEDGKDGGGHHHGHHGGGA